ncbi:MAG: beta-lactamase family protein, partial [Acidobacteria bacterium]|nr:beta-lactamase family protein [Acidobacteriota bacterium]
MHPFPPRSLGRWREVCLALAMPALVAAGQEAVPPPTPVDVLRSAVDQGTTPGAALLVVQGGETLQEVYLGRYHPDLVLPFDGASAWLSTVTVLSLADAGLLELEDPLVKFFPDTPDEKAAITLRQVLSHTAGLSSSHPCQADRETTLESCAQAVLESPLAGTPGREFLFGGAGL